MSVVAGDIDFYLSGGAANTDPNASLGGARSTTTQIVDATLHNLFDIVSSAESSAGDTEYRCIYIENANGVDTLQSAEVLIQTDTSSADTDLEIALGTSAIDGTEQTVADESTAPTGVTWETGATPLAIGDLGPGQHKALWIRRVVSAAAGADPLDNAVIRVQGDTV